MKEVSHNSKLCQNGINILWGLSLLPHLGFVALLNSLVKNNGIPKDTGVEINPPTDDVNDVGVGMESGRVVHDTTRPNKSTSGSSECTHGGHDRCICGMDESRG